MMSQTNTPVEKRVLEVRESIAVAARKAGRSPDTVTLIAVSKTFPPDAIKEAIEAGLTVFGENRIQEARPKIQELSKYTMTRSVSWHFIGHLQRNKARFGVRIFDMIHSVDSLKLSEELNREAEKLEKHQKILLQVKLSDEEAKHGVSHDSLSELIEKTITLTHLRIEGLMTMPPYFEDAEKARPYYRRLREIRDSLEKGGVRLPELSMGMSNDYAIAIEEGATMVRVGTALFGERASCRILRNQ